MFTLQPKNGTLCTEVLPEAGSGLLRLDLLHDCDIVPIFRSGTAEAALHDLRALTCFPLMPWFNHISGGRSPFRRRVIEVPHTHGDELYLLHGHGWLMPWYPVSQTAMSAELAVMVDHGCLLRYLALQCYALAGNTLNIALTVRSEGPPLPLRLDVRLFFPRTFDIQLRAGATVMRQFAPDNLPTALNVSFADADLCKLRKLEASIAINHNFEGRDGHAEIVWPSRRVFVSITADTSRYTLYMPIAYDFFCFEPVDHAINAHNLSDLL